MLEAGSHRIKTECTPPQFLSLHAERRGRKETGADKEPPVDGALVYRHCVRLEWIIDAYCLEGGRNKLGFIHQTVRRVLFAPIGSYKSLTLFVYSITLLGAGGDVRSVTCPVRPGEWGEK